MSLTVSSAPRPLVAHSHPVAVTPRVTVAAENTFHAGHAPHTAHASHGTPTPIPVRFAAGDPLAAPSAVDHSHHHGNHGVHGMVMFGSGERLFLSHIPMFQPPHNRQVLLEVSAPALAGKSFSEGAFTFRPDAFSLDALVAGDLKTIRGTVFEGNFESGGRPIVAGVELTLRAIPVADPLNVATPAAESLEYFVMGSGADAFLVHRIAGEQDFDQVVKVSLEDGAVLPPGARLTFPERTPDVARRLREGESLTAVVTPTGETVRVTVDRELSVLVGPDFTSPPPAGA